MKRFVNGFTSKSMVTSEDNITAYENWQSLSHTSYTLDRYAQLLQESTVNFKKE